MAELHVLEGGDEEAQLVDVLGVLDGVGEFLEEQPLVAPSQPEGLDPHRAHRHAQLRGDVPVRVPLLSGERLLQLLEAKRLAASFMQYLRANLSRKVGRLVDWSGGFWVRRYSAEPVLTTRTGLSIF